MPNHLHRLLFLMLVLLTYAEHAAGQNTPQEDDSRLPRAAPHHALVNRSALLALSEKLGSRDCQKLDSLILVKRGKVVFERYQNGYTAQKVHDIASITKSVTSLLVGIAMDRGDIPSVEKRVWEYFEDTPYGDQWPADKRSITIQHLLSMQHGIACDDYDDPDMRRFKKWLKSDDRIAAVLNMPMDCEPGTKTAYCTASTQLLRQVIEKATGQRIERFAKQVLFDPLGMSSFQWDRSPKHGVSVGFGADACPRDLAVLGRMIEQKGKWNDQQIVSSKWIEESFKRRGTLLGIDYGYLWYGEPYSVGPKKIQSHLAMGHGGQFLILFPELQSILVITATDYRQELDVYQLIQDFVIPVCSEP